MKKNYTCECGMTVNEGEKCKGYTKLTEHDLDLLEIKCSGCGMLVKVGTIREQGVEKWHKIYYFPGLFCPGCSHSLQL